MQLNWLGAELELSSLAPRSMTNSHACVERAVPRRQHERWFAKARAILQVWGQRMRQRTELAQLLARERRDIGVSEADVWAEPEKWFWQE